MASRSAILHPVGHRERRNQEPKSVRTRSKRERKQFTK